MVPAADSGSGLTPLHLAAEHGSVDCLTELLAAGADKARVHPFLAGSGPEFFLVFDAVVPLIL